MKIESPDFTADDLRQTVFHDLVDVERRATIARLRDLSTRMRTVAVRVPEQPPTADGAWNPKEVLAHMAVASKGWGAIAYLVAKGRMPSLIGQQVITQRDPLGMEMVSLPVAQITEQAAIAHARSLAYLEQASSDELNTRFTWELGEASALDLFRLMLAAHLEQHVEQLENALG